MLLLATAPHQWRITAVGWMSSLDGIPPTWTTPASPFAGTPGNVVDVDVDAGEVDVVVDVEEVVDVGGEVVDVEKVVEVRPVVVVARPVVVVAGRAGALVEEAGITAGP
jgi:hypothetical protein